MTKTLVPLGGLGNRYRSIKSFLEAAKPDEHLVLVSIRTPYFPIHLDRVFEFKGNIKLIKFPFRVQDKVSTYSMRVFCLLFGFFGAAPYGSREVVTKNWLYCSPHQFHHTKETCPLKLRMPNGKGNIVSEPDGYNAVHIRRGDNKAAIDSNDMAVYRRFIQSSRKRVFVASDDIETKESLSREFPGQVITIDFNLDRKSISSFRDALVEIEILVRAEKFKGSNKSSFSQLVNELRGECADYRKGSS